jgi:two-component system sensor histidine kinase MtrB
VLVEVSDHGPGILPADLSHVFERFFKADPARAAEGTGLGLAIALENAKLLGGRIDARSSPGRGTTFRLVLPVAGSLPPGDPTVSEPADAEVETPSDTEVK